MIILKNTDALYLTNTDSGELNCWVNYVDINTTTKTITYGSTITNIPLLFFGDNNISGSPASGTIRQIKSVQTENTGTVPMNIYFSINVSGTFNKIFSAKLGVGENININVNGDFTCHANDGSVKNLTTSTTFENYIASNKQRILYVKTAARTSVAASYFSVIDLAGNPGAGTLAGTSTTAGVVPTSATVGFPLINPISAAKGQIGSVQFSNTVASRMTMFDCLFKAGAYSFNSNVTLSAQPSYSTRIPSTSNYNDTEIWIEAVTAFTGNLSVNIGYVNQSGVSKTTGVIATGVAPTVGRMIQIPLASGDTGIQKINSVVASVSTAGTFNVLVLRRLVSGRVKVANDTHTLTLAETGMPEVYSNSALFVAVTPDGTTTGIPEVFFDIIG